MTRPMGILAYGRRCPLEKGEKTIFYDKYVRHRRIRLRRKKNYRHFVFFARRGCRFVFSYVS